ncbi:hypothetical protein D0469_09065 [Peribacillus saganii]|uniref:Uncharacterized protein n=1 Tax=Peribacillus saganii TaxID=2303992 RepID=A0A372LP24_9BACI|nr:hypothetical protein [Peribacillus saganii]RFU69505.1 hypothetical protein D0469_09065 [Peribacillus saganii]
MSTCELVKRAYDRYVEINRHTEDEKSIKELGDEYTYRVERAIEDFIHNKNMSLFADDKNNLLYSNGKFWAGIGPGKMARENFKEFLDHEQTKSVIRSILTRDFSQNQNRNLIREYFVYRDRFSYLQGVSFPGAYTNRLFTILLRDISTTISNEKILIDVANAMGLFTNNKSFGELQLYVRSETDKCLKELGLYNQCSTFDKAVISWFIHIELTAMVTMP